MIGMWLMYARTEIIVTESLANQADPAHPRGGLRRHRRCRSSASSAPRNSRRSGPSPTLASLQLLMVVLVPGLLALVFGWLAFRSRVTGVYLSILTQAMTLALSLYLFQNDTGLRGNNGLSGLQNIPGADPRAAIVISIWFFWASALALGLGYLSRAWIVSGKMGSVIRGIRDDEARVRFLGYHGRKLQALRLHPDGVISGIAGALYYPQAGIINPAEIAPIASIYLAVWVAIGGRGRLYGAVIGAVFVSLLSSWFTGGGAPDINLGFYTIQWTDWWLVLLGLAFVAVTLFAPKGLGGLFDNLVRKEDNEHASGGLRRLRLLRRLQGDQQPVVPDRRARAARHHRPQRRGQDHLHGHRHRQDPARRGPRDLGRVGTSRCWACPKPDRARGDRPQVPETHRLRGPDRAREPRHGAEEPARPLRRAVLPKTARDRARIEEIAERSASADSLTRPRANSATARSNGWRSACCWRRTRGSCWSTSPPPA
jgi:urea transport system permease protein